MERGERFNTTCFINEIINELVPNLKRRGGFPDKRWYRLHLDNARPHNSRDSVDYIDRQNVVRLSHPLHSPDLAPGDFYLSANTKQRLAKCHGTTREEVFQNVNEFLQSISEDELVRVFLNWMTRLEQVIATGGEYI
jgi:hypothetical protein